MIIDPQEVSFEEIKNDVVEYVQSKPDYASWKDFYESSAGTTLIELIAGFSTYLTYQHIVNRRETYLFHALNRSSKVAISQTLGYSIFRGKNIHLTLTITPNTTRAVTNFDIVGEFNGYDIVSLGDYVLNSGVQTTIDIALGEVKEEIKSVESSDLTVFRFESDLVSEDIQILKNSIEMPLGTAMSDMLNDKYVPISNPVNAVDVFYLNTSEASYRYENGDVLTLKYIELKDLALILPADLDRFTFLYGTIDDASVINRYQIPEPNNNIVINAPIYHEVQKVIRGRDDYKKLLKTLISDVSDVNARDYSPAIVELTYVKEDLTLLSTTEKNNLIDELSSYRPFGMYDPPMIRDPRQVDLELNIDITLSVLIDDIAQADVESDVDSILTNYDKLLGITIDLHDIENEINELDYVKINRVEIIGDPSTEYELEWDQYVAFTYNLTLA